MDQDSIDDAVGITDVDKQKKKIKKKVEGQVNTDLRDTREFTDNAKVLDDIDL
ncbi:MAG TPA: hypothetical protein VJ792_01670 [Candidatus Nitrosotalea sp.]|nr:hypothetical protein [Candidatus Nitrosotalea sp.]